MRRSQIYKKWWSSGLVIFYTAISFFLVFHHHHHDFSKYSLNCPACISETQSQDNPCRDDSLSKSIVIAGTSLGGLIVTENIPSLTQLFYGSSSTRSPPEACSWSV
jgi:hypothetical protein